MSIAVEKTFTEDMRQFMFTRIERTDSWEVLPPEHRKVSDQYTELLEKLRLTLSGENKKMLDQLDDLSAYIGALEQDFFYNSGFSDGVKFILHSLTGGAV